MNGTPVVPPAPAGLEFKDRRTGLIAVGIVEILFGGLAALMIPLMVLGQVMAAQTTAQSLSMQQTILASTFYALAAAVLIGLGIGSCMARRWARALSLIVAWSWLVFGVVGMVAMAFVLPDILHAQQPQGQPLPESARLAAMLISLFFMGILFVAVPLVLVFFYSSRHVKATCEARNPSPGWTDACPLPVLALSLWLGYGAVALLALPLSTNGVLPLFGRLFSGVGGWLVCVVLAAVWAYCAWAVYGLRLSGWWVVLVSLCVIAASSWVTFTRIDLAEMYRAMGYPEQQIDMMKQVSLFQGERMAYVAVAAAVPMLGYVLFIRRYFRSTA